MFKFKKLFSLPFQIIFALVIAFTCNNYMSLETKQFFYSCSVTILDVLNYLLPFIVFSFLFSSLSSLDKNGIKAVLILFLLIIASNFIATMFGYGASTLLISNVSSDLIINTDKIPQESIANISYFNFGKLLDNQYGLLAGLILGLITPYVKQRHQINKLAIKLKNISLFFLTKIFIKTIPFFIFGFAIKIVHDGDFVKIFSSYWKTLLIIFLVEAIYLVLMYCLAANFNLKKAKLYFSRVIPAGLTGFSTMSSAAAMPLNLTAGEENTHNPKLVETVIPTTTNVHLIGDNILVTMLALTLLVSFNMPMPTLWVFLPYAFFSSLSKFAIVSVPGGGITVMLPLLKAYLGFPNELTSIIFSMYVLLDSFNTMVNVFGNGAFVLIVDKFAKNVFKKS